MAKMVLAAPAHISRDLLRVIGFLFFGRLKALHKNQRKSITLQLISTVPCHLVKELFLMVLGLVKKISVTYITKQKMI